ncbi:hypothetical protein [Lactobacillus kefiranofaciens]|uniref:hypothetical protein n=1 Tax=Lactobacillus kefiranofaciens TaxID=267818 RepID=UPI002150DCB6|nr:hypothetical protein [Lactobacillus kefiranofaciens]
MTSIIVFIAVTIMAILTAINIYKIINAHVTYKRYYPYRKLVMVALISFPWIFFLVFPFTLDWGAYITLVIVRIPYTIIWSLLIAAGIYIDIKMQNKYQHHKDNNRH